MVQFIEKKSKKMFVGQNLVQWDKKKLKNKNRIDFFGSKWVAQNPTRRYKIRLGVWDP